MTTLRVCPRTSMSARYNSNVASKSQRSVGTSWKCHFSLPLSGSRATMLHVYRLSPRRFEALRSDDGLPTPQYRRLNSGSYDPVIQVALPPIRQLSPGQVSLPFSPG